MMDLNGKIKSVVESFCVGEDSFTSLDISNCVKQEGFASSRHRDIATAVRCLYTDGIMRNYRFMRTLIQVTLSSGADINTYLYHHYSVDHADYNNRSQISIPPVNNSDQDDVVTDPPTLASLVQAAAGNLTQPVAQTVTMTNPDFIQTIKNRSDGRLEIPTDWLKSLDWGPRESVYIVLDNNEILVKMLSEVADGDNVLTTIHVGGNGRLHISKKAFVEADFQYNFNNIHEVELLGDIIVIKDDDTTTRPTFPTRTFCF